MQTSAEIILLVPNDWVSEKVLIAVTGLKPGTITRARKESRMLGREYLHISPDGNPKPSSECMYNRKAVDQWIEAQKKINQVRRQHEKQYTRQRSRTSGGLMANASYPTGVENHGGSLRIWFVYKGKRVRETSVSLILPKSQDSRRASFFSLFCDKDGKF